MKEKLTILEASKIMNVSPQFLRIGLQKDKFPFGFAVKMEKKWSYYVSKVRLENYLKGGDLNERSI